MKEEALWGKRSEGCPPNIFIQLKKMGKGDKSNKMNNRKQVSFTNIIHVQFVYLGRNLGAADQNVPVPEVQPNRRRAVSH